jgi:CRP-like cAMP-binding protein
MIEDQQVKFKKPIQILKPSDIFGAVYPFTEEIRSQSHVMTLKRTELIRITKEKLFRMCRMHAELEGKIIGLLQIRCSKSSKKGSALARKVKRYNLSAPISIEIIPDTEGSTPIRIAGCLRDLSVSGLCFITPHAIVTDSHQSALKEILNRQRPEVRVILSIEKMSLIIPGKIVRKEKVLENGQIHLSLGIRFEDLPPIIGGAFFAFAQSVNILSLSSTSIEDSKSLAH